MVTNEFKQLLMTKLPKENLFFDEVMKDYTTFKIGGKVDVMFKPKTNEEIAKAIKLCKAANVPYYILGNGSNLLVSDEGFRGMVIQIFNNLSEIQVDGTCITAMAGALLAKIASVALRNELTGFEFAHGIPGTIGGAIVMNAGAYDGEMKNVVKCVVVLTEAGKIIELTKDELELGYRTSIIQKKGYIVLSVTIELAGGDQAAIQDKMKDFAGRRRDKQPLEKPSAGSTFKRPEGYFAGKLIMDSGLRGYQIGGARVSDKHCGFVVNEGGATCKDVEALIKHVQDVVWEKYQVKLEPEVKRMV